MQINYLADICQWITFIDIYKTFFTSTEIGLFYPIFRNQCSLISLSALPGLDSFYRPSGWSVFYKAEPWFTALSHYFLPLAVIT